MFSFLAINTTDQNRILLHIIKIEFDKYFSSFFLKELNIVSEFSLEIEKGLTIVLESFSETFPKFSKDFFQSFTNFLKRPFHIQEALQLYQINLDSMNNDITVVVVLNSLYDLLFREIFSLPSKIIQTMNQTTFTQDNISRKIQDVFYETTIWQAYFGDISNNQVEETSKIVEEMFNSSYLKPNQTLVKLNYSHYSRVSKLNQCVHFRMINPKKSDENNGIISYFNLPYDINDCPPNLLVNDIVNHFFFKIVRETHSLGYAVGAN